MLLGELARYQPDLLDRPRLVVGSRADLVAGETGEGGGQALDLVISAVTGQGVPELLGRLAGMVTAAREAEAAKAASPAGEVVVHRPAPEGVRSSGSGPGCGGSSAGRPSGRSASPT